MKLDEQEFYQWIGEKIANARKENRLTQQQLAGRIGLSRTSIGNIEKGRQHPTIHSIWVIADKLNITPSSLLPMDYEFGSPDTDDYLKKVGQLEGIKQDEKALLADFIKTAFK